jgi:hypothetical protein
LRHDVLPAVPARLVVRGPDGNDMDVLEPSADLMLLLVPATLPALAAGQADVLSEADVAALVGEGTIAERLGDPETAAQAYGAALELAPRQAMDAGVHLVLGQLIAALPRATAVHGERSDELPGEAPWHVRRAAERLRAGDLETAKFELALAFLLTPRSDPSAATILGLWRELHGGDPR